MSSTRPTSSTSHPPCRGHRQPSGGPPMDTDSLPERYSGPRSHDLRCPATLPPPGPQQKLLGVFWDSRTICIFTHRTTVYGSRQEFSYLSLLRLTVLRLSVLRFTVLRFTVETYTKNYWISFVLGIPVIRRKRSSIENLLCILVLGIPSLFSCTRNTGFLKKEYFFYV